jgi:hypothetical protein
LFRVGGGEYRLVGRGRWERVSRREQIEFGIFWVVVIAAFVGCVALMGSKGPEPDNFVGTSISG